MNADKEKELRKPIREPKKHPAAKLTKSEEDKRLEEGLEETFPASDQVSVTTTGNAKRPAGKTNERPPAKR